MCICLKVEFGRQVLLDIGIFVGFRGVVVVLGCRFDYSNHYVLGILDFFGF